MPFSVHWIDRPAAERPQFAVCRHDCRQLLRVVSQVSGETEFECCALEAALLAPALARAAGASHGLHTSGGSFVVTAAPHAEAAWPQFLICDHGCAHVVQIGHPLWRGAVLEICAAEAGALAMQLSVSLDHAP